MKTVIDFLNNLVWNSPEAFPILVAFLVGTGIFITIRLGFVQLQHFKHAINVTRGKYDNPEDDGDVTHFQALTTALSATIGIGNIAGVALAIHYGGPGTLFWMWVTGIFGTSLKFTECTLSLKYRKINPDGSASGGPMYYMEKALGWKGLAIVFAFATAISSLGQGNAVQANTVADIVTNVIKDDFMYSHHLAGGMIVKGGFVLSQYITGIILTLIVALVIIGGIKRIGNVTKILAPGMTILYVLGGVTILLYNIQELPNAFSAIFKGAFAPKGVAGGTAASVFLLTLVHGVKRGLFSNEAGQGSAAIAHSAAKTTEPVREGTVAMLGPYIDTIVICTITGLCIIVTGAYKEIDGSYLNGAPMTAYAFKQGLPFLMGYGEHIVTAAVILFATSTAISWYYYGDRAVQYLFGNTYILIYKIIYISFIFIGAISELKTIWAFGDFAIALMTIPNLIALIALSKKVKNFKNDYFKDNKHLD